jgi:hypothetical protein
MPNFRNVELSTNTVPGTEQLFYYFIVGDTDNLIGKRILPNRLNREEYLRFLSDTLSELLDEVSLDIMQGMCYLHDGAPPHYARQIRSGGTKTTPKSGLDETVQRNTDTCKFGRRTNWSRQLVPKFGQIVKFFKRSVHQ